MGLVTTVALKSLRKRPGRTLFSILGIAMGIAIVVGVFTLDHNTLLGLKSPGDPDWQADVRVSPTRELENPRATLADLPGVDGVSAFFQNEADLASANAKRLSRVRLFGLETDSIPTSTFYQIEEGTELAEGDVLIGRALAERLGLGVGATIELIRPKRGAKKLCVDGEMKSIEPEEQLTERKRSFRVCGIIAARKLGRRSGGDVAILGFGAARELFEDVLGSVDYVLEKNPKVDIERLTSSLGRAFSYELNQDVIIGQAADERAFRNGVRFAGLLALGLGLYVIFHVLSIALVERSREIATLQALGATRGQIARIFLAEAGFLAGFGGLAGLGGGILLARLLLALKITTLGAGRNINVFEIPWVTVLPLALIGAGIALLGSVYPLMRMRRSDIARAIRGERSLEQGGPGFGFRLFAVILVSVVLPILFLQISPLVGETKDAISTVLYVGMTVFAVLVGLPLLVPGVLGRVASVLVRALDRCFPLGALVASREIARRPLRLAVGAAVLAMVAAAFTTLQGITTSLKDEISNWAEVAVANKIFLAGLDGVEVDALDGVLAGTPGLLAHERGDIRAYVPFLLTGLGEKAADVAGIFSTEAAKTEFFRGRGIVVSTRLARDQKLEVGGEIPIRSGRGTVETFRILAVSDAVGFFPYPDERLYGVIAEETMRRDFCVDLSRADRMALVFAPGTDLDAVAREVAKRITSELDPKHEPEIATGTKVEADALYDVGRDFVLFDVIILLTAALGGLGVLNGQLLSALERSRELGVLKALGCSRRQMAGLVMVEALTIGIIGGVLGAILGVLLCPPVIAALQMVSAFDLPQPNVRGAALLAVLGAIVVSLLSALYPMFKVVTTGASSAVREG